MNTQSISNEIARLQKMIDRKKEEIKEHEELKKMWEDKLKEPAKP